ncbi:squamosa promoter-binding-like protein 14 [Salvia miltiorrhiza]|uniref:squamosa promoter-binding-like protein 14 n=1 Tax=Salvia miltiorrhiza TaxID=226208 RepID=UPI0025AD2536|nr:squamosa promoter-binding-like protein 14 [Salvia miltiorrhiza]XP_057794764.1 squamosa promoter-binding-like protein 14 [Salvia miltiorrhiza]XP_057794765.1 squamosa promoter-binding-like protein 14 [Salvia miltiorrhiza]XP_057794766.1 squamosa promoter-binding-like protein 14 [Salvia miltiorrhiza]
MEEVGARIVAPTVIHQHLTARFCDPYPMAKKRALPFDSSSFLPQNTAESWNPKSWNWDSARFVAKPLQRNGGQVGGGEEIQPAVPRRKQVLSSASYSRTPAVSGEVDDNLVLNLRGGDGARSSGNTGGVNLVEPQTVSRPNKKVRSGSPGGTNYPMCQVDNCKEDLSTAKDYHRRHKVCEVHSKAGKALIGNQMQRFCQQCSRFHPLSEFDEGKRSCRRRLAGHNRRRRKTQPEDTTQRLLTPVIGDSNVGDNDVLNLLAVLTSAQGNIVDRNDKFPLIPNKDQLIQILSKINSLQLPANLAAKLNGINSNHISLENQNQINGNASSASTMNLLAALSATARAPSSDVFETQSQPSTEGSDSEKSKSPCPEKHGGSTMEFQETSPSVPLKLFSPSPEDYRPKKSPPDRNFLSSGSSYPSDETSPLSTPPVVHDLFPMQTSRDTDKNDHLSNSEGEIATINGCSTSLQLFGVSISGTEDVPAHTSPYRAGYTSSSASDHSSQNSDAQDRTGRIIFKLFDKDPSHMPGSLRDQIYNWLSNSPSEMESYIRPGCIVLSLYLSMPSFAWDQLEDNLLNYVKSLVKDIDIDFWGNGRFLIHTDRQMVSHKEGKIRLCKSLRAWSTPELISVSPVAVVGGQQTTLLLRGRSLKAPGTRIHCTQAVGYNIREVHSSLCHKTPYDEIILADFKVNGAASNVLGRCFIEVENSLRGSNFPIIIANSTICQELRLLEPEINGTSDICSDSSTDNIEKTAWVRSREESLHFLDELGWLFQRKYNSCLFEIPDYRLTRFKFLLVFSVEHDFCALVKALLDILLELNSGREGLEKESLELLSEIHLLNRAVRRSCASMVDFLIHYSIVDSSGTSERFIFVPNMAGPGGLTPLHLAASASSSDDIVDLLTSDRQEVGLHSWNSVLDANGLSPHAYALMRNNHSYNALVAQKLADKSNGQVSVTIEDDIKHFQVEMDKEGNTKSHLNRGQQSCSRCAYGYSKRIPGSKGLLQRPYIHSMLVVAAVCVCVCLFLRGHPFVGRVSPFSWENLEYGTI